MSPVEKWESFQKVLLWSRQVEREVLLAFLRVSQTLSRHTQNHPALKPEALEYPQNQTLCKKSMIESSVATFQALLSF